MIMQIFFDKKKFLQKQLENRGNELLLFKNNPPAKINEYVLLEKIEAIECDINLIKSFLEIVDVKFEEYRVRENLREGIEFDIFDVWMHLYAPQEVKKKTLMEKLALWFQEKYIIL